MSGKLIELDGQRVSLKGEMIILTGLWKAAGSDPSKQPAKWRELPSTQEFVSYLSEFILRKSEDYIFDVSRGRNAQTFAHWQIAMNYARYLDPAFAVRCNEIVRLHMERNIAPAGFPAELMEMVKRTDGIVRMLAHKVTTIEKAVADNAQEQPAFTIIVEPKKRKSA